MYTKIFGPLESPDVMTQIESCANEHAVASALMADHHLGYSMPIGGVIAYEDVVSPSGVGFDISCGCKAVLTDADPEDVVKNISTIMDDVVHHISFGVGRVNKEPLEHALFEKDSHPAWDIPEILALKRNAHNQLGTVGSGNHYVDILLDKDTNKVWVACHFGSRGLGHAIATHYLKAGGGKDGMMEAPTLLGVNSDLGQQYLIGMDLAGQYAYAGRDWVCSRVAKILGANILDEVHNHHNYTWKENHFGKDLYVVRKGATPAFPGQRGFVGGSMGDISVIIKGIESESSKDALYSTIHGAGRVMSRTKAAGKSRWKKGKKVKISEGVVSTEMMHDWLRPMKVELRGGGTDESPHCYKRIEAVLGYHEGTIEIENVLHPLGVAMAGEDTFDPYKD